MRAVERDVESSETRFPLPLSGMAVIFAAAGFLVSVAIAGIVFYQSQRSNKQAAQAEADVYADALSQRARISQAYLRAVNARIRGADVLTAEEFESFVGFLGPEPALDVVMWAPRVEADVRGLYEEQMRESGLANFEIVDRDQAGAYVRATRRPEYFPIRFVAGRGAGERRVGLDLGSIPSFQSIITRSLDSGQTVSTPPGPLPDGEMSFVIVEPVVTTSGSGSERKISGMVAGAFRLDLLVAAAAPASLITREVVIQDLEEGSEPTALRPTTRVTDVPAGWPHKDVSIAGREWRVYLEPPDGRAAENALIVLLVGLMLTGLSVVLADRGQQRLIAQDLKREVVRQTAALQRSTAEFRALFEEGGTGKCELVPDTQLFRRVNLQLCQMLGYEREELLERGLNDVLHADDTVSDEPAYRTLLEGGSDTYSAEKRFVRKDGSVFWCEVSATVLRDESDHPVWTVAVIQDITSRKQAEETRQLLVRELAHRVKNTLQVARSLADQTGRYVSDLPSFLHLYHGRLRALGMAHDQLFKTDWGGAHLEDIISGTFGTFGLEEGERVEVDVPNVLLSSAETQTLALILNELATNAAKHGALSNDAGRVSISGRIEDGGDAPGEPEQWLIFNWRESGGPTVRKPKKPGFGMTFLTRAVQHQHGGSTGFEWLEDGVNYTLRLPLRKDEEEKPPATAARGTRPAISRRRGRSAS